MKRRFDQSFPLPRKMLPLIVFGCDFRKGVCKTCGLEGNEGELVTCKLAETWAKGKGHFGPRGSYASATSRY